MKLIRNATLLAAFLTISGTSMAAVGHKPRSLEQVADALTTTAPKTTRPVDREEQYFTTGMDYTQESRLNHRNRDEFRQKSRERKTFNRSQPDLDGL